MELQLRQYRATAALLDEVIQLCGNATVSLLCTCSCRGTCQPGKHTAAGRMPHQAVTLWKALLQLVQQIPTQSSNAQQVSNQKALLLLMQLTDIDPTTLPKATWQQIEKLQVKKAC